MRIIVAQRAKAVELFLAGRVPKRKLDVYIIDEDVVYVVLEYGGLTGQAELDAS